MIFSHIRWFKFFIMVQVPELGITTVKILIRIVRLNPNGCKSTTSEDDSAVITTIKIESFKSIEKAEIKFGNPKCIHRANGPGKSNFL